MKVSFDNDESALLRIARSSAALALSADGENFQLKIRCRDGEDRCRFPIKRVSVEIDSLVRVLETRSSAFALMSK